MWKRGKQSARYAGLAVILSFIFLCASCESLVIHGKSTDGYPLSAEGRIFTARPLAGAKPEDIVLSGSFSRSDMSDTMGRKNRERIVWEGTVFRGDDTLPLRVTFDRGADTDGADGLYYIKVHGLPEMYRFPVFSITDGGPYGTRLIDEKRLPFEVAPFSIHDVPLGFYCAAIMSNPLNEGAKVSVLQLMSEKDQVFRILDGDGCVFAEFSGATYRVFATHISVEPDAVWPCIGVWTLIHDICVNGV